MTVLDGIPGALVHGRYDVSSPLDTAWRLQRRWGARLHVVDDAGHGGAGSFADAVVDAVIGVADEAKARRARTASG